MEPPGQRTQRPELLRVRPYRPPVASASLIGRLGQALSDSPDCSVDVARGLALLFGIGTEALP